MNKREFLKNAGLFTIGLFLKNFSIPAIPKTYDISEVSDFTKLNVGDKIKNYFGPYSKRDYSVGNCPHCGRNGVEEGVGTFPANTECPVLYGHIFKKYNGNVYGDYCYVNEAPDLKNKNIWIWRNSTYSHKLLRK